MYGDDNDDDDDSDNDDDICVCAEIVRCELNGVQYRPGQTVTDNCNTWSVATLQDDVKTYDYVKVSSKDND